LLLLSAHPLLLFFSSAKRKVAKESAGQKNRARAHSQHTLPFFGLARLLSRVATPVSAVMIIA
jgi:hypothetical protein